MLNDSHTTDYTSVFHFSIFDFFWIFNLNEHIIGGDPPGFLPFEMIWWISPLQIIIKIIKLISELMRLEDWTGLDLFLNSDVDIIEHLLGVCCAWPGLEEMWGESLSYLTWTGHPWHDQNLLQIVPHVSSNRHKIQCHCNLLCPSTHVLFKVISACKKAQWPACLDQALCMGIEASLEE